MQKIIFDQLSIRFPSLLKNISTPVSLKNNIAALFSGAIVNQSENRSATHFELRDSDAQVDALKNMSRVIDKLTLNHSGKARHIINIGVGGSNLGPVMACYALDEYSQLDHSIQQHFISAMDGFELKRLLRKLNPEAVTFIVYSKSFSTKDTLLNANTAVQWAMEKLKISREQVLSQCFIGVTAKPERATEWGLPAENQLVFAESVGGRYSIWSAVGLPLALQIGLEGFKEFLAGAKMMDEHFAQAPLAENIPVQLGVLGAHYAKDLNIATHLVLPYDSRLKYFPAYLGQLEMESNGKSVTQQNQTIAHRSAPMLWGGNGTDAQHSYFQLLHQGTHTFSADILLFREGMRSSEYSEQLTQEFEQQHQYALANGIAQSRLFATGNLAENPEAHKQHKGGNYVTTLIMDELSPFTLGQLISLYEHKVYTMASLWNINPFDQWGVEKGKVIAETLYQSMQSSQVKTNARTDVNVDINADAHTHDELTQVLINDLKRKIY